MNNTITDYLRYCNMWNEFYVRNFVLPWTQMYSEMLAQNGQSKEKQ